MSCPPLLPPSICTLLSILKTTFPPEFINRLDEIVIFKPLTIESIYAITRSLTENLKRKTSAIGIELTFTDECIRFISEKGYSKSYGARELRRTLTQLAEDTLAEKILSGEIKAGDAVTATLEDGRIVFKKSN